MFPLNMTFECQHQLTTQKNLPLVISQLCVDQIGHIKCLQYRCTGGREVRERKQSHKYNAQKTSITVWSWSLSSGFQRVIRLLRAWHSITITITLSDPARRGFYPIRNAYLPLVPTTQHLCSPARCLCPCRDRQRPVPISFLFNYSAGPPCELHPERSVYSSDSELKPGKF